MNSLIIGKTASTAQDIFSRFGLAPFREILKPREFEEAASEHLPHNRRDRALCPEVVVWLMLLTALQKDSMASALRWAWTTLRCGIAKLPVKVVSTAAWSTARARTTLEYFRHLFEVVRERFQSNFGAAMKWKGLRVLAGDGSCVALPEFSKLRQYFGSQRGRSNSQGPPMGRLVTLVSIFTGICVDFVFVPLACGETTALASLIPRVEEKDLILLDRGFHCWGLIWTIMQRRCHVLVRLKGKPKPIQRKRLGKNDWLCTFKLRAVSRKNWPGSPLQIELRVIKSHKIGHRPVYLATSIMNPDFASREELSNLYWRRWRIETVYNELKNVLHIENLRSQSAPGIEKEICAHMLLSNLTRWIMQEAAEKHYNGQLTAVHLSFKTAIETVGITAQEMLRAPAQILPVIYEQLLETLATAKVKERPGRSYPRNIRRRTNSTGHSSSGKTKIPA